MPTIDLTMLIARLNDASRRTLETPAGSVLSRTRYNVEAEHWLLQLVELPGSDVASIARAFEIGRDRTAAQLAASLNRMATGNGRAPSLAPEMVSVMKTAWLFASVDQDQAAVRSGHFLWAALSDAAIAARPHGAPLRSPASPTTSPRVPARARSTRSSAATPRSAR